MMETSNKQIRVHRTVEGTLFETAAAVLIVIMWCVIAWMWNNVPDTIPIHFNISGEADGFGGKWNLLLLGGIGTLCTALTLVSAYFPGKMINVPVDMDNGRQYMLAIRMCRVIGVLMALLFISIVVSIYNGGAYGMLSVVVPVGLILAVVAYFSFMIYRAR